MTNNLVPLLWNTDGVATSVRPLVHGLPHVQLPLRAQSTGKPAAVLVAITPENTPRILLVQRVDTARHHAGQPAFPGGAIDLHDESPVAAAVREAQEEVGLLPEHIHVFAQLPPLWIPVSDYSVTTVVAQWTPGAQLHMQESEIARAHLIPVDQLAHNRVQVQHSSGYVGAGFQVEDMVVWGFTGGVVAALLDAAGWSVPWDPTRVIPAPVLPPRAMITDDRDFLTSE